jgi:ribosomal protein S21
MVEVQRKEKESTNALARRFTRKIQQSRLLQAARALRYRERPTSRTKKRKDALRRIAKAREYEILRKLGKIE